MNELIAQLVSQLGVQEGQAKGGAGLLLKMAQSKLGGDFSKVSEAVPGLGGLVGALGGGKAGGLADLASLAGGFSQLKLDPQMISKFVPVILSFVQSKGGQDVVKLLAGVLKK